MNRRSFLTALTASAGAIVLPEPRRVYSFPSAGWLERQSRILPGFTVTLRPQWYVFSVPPMQLRQELETRIFEAISHPQADLTPSGIEYVKRTIERTLERYQASIDDAALSRVVIRGKVSI